MTSPQTSEEAPKLQRTLTNRHIQLIAIGGAIGTGLFMGSGKTIATAGPAVLLVYAITGGILFLFMRGMGELLLAKDAKGSFAEMAREILGPWAGFVTGWTYWLCWVVTAIAEMVAITAYVHFWWPDLPSWIPVMATILILFTLNALTVKAFGEVEFWFALIKIVAIIALIVIGVVMVVSGDVSDDGVKASVTNLWEHGGFFPTGFSGFIGGFQIAIFAFVGIELVGTTVAETADPHKTLPKAINSIPVRILLFYLGALAVIMMVTPWDDVDPNVSPFVTMFAMTGLVAAASVVNLVVLSSAASSANSGIYSTSRMLFGLAHGGDAPAVFGKLSSRHVPLNGLFLTCVCLPSAILVLAMGDSLIGAFTIVTSMASTLFMAVWAIIMASYLVHDRQHPEMHAESDFPLPGGRFSAWLVLAFMAAMWVVLAIEPETRPGLIAAVAWMVGIVAMSLVHRHRMLMRAAAAAEAEADAAASTD